MDKKLLAIVALLITIAAVVVIVQFTSSESDGLDVDGDVIESGQDEASHIGPRRDAGTKPPTKAATEAPKVSAFKSEAQIHGRVVEGKNADPVPGATITLKLLSGEELATRITNSKGRFDLKAPANEAPLLIVASHEDRVSPKMTDLELAVGEDRDVGDLVLQAAAEIRGVVKNEKGAPLSGARLRLVPNIAITTLGVETIKKLLDGLSTEDKPLAEQLSDAEGKFVFESVAVGNYAVIADAEGRETRYSSRINLKPGQARKEIEFLLDSALKLKGTVTDSEGEAVAGASIRVLPNSRDFPSLFRTINTTTDAQGHYEINSLGQGRHMMMCRAEGLAPWGDNFTMKAPKQVDIKLTPGWALKGVTLEEGTDKPIEGVEIAILSDDLIDIPRAMSNAKGEFEFSNIPDKKLEAVIVHMPGMQVAQVGKTRVMNGPFSIINVRKGPDGKYPESLEIRLTGKGRIEGRVIDSATGNGIANARVFSTADADREFAMISAGGAVRSDEKGNFVLNSVPSGGWQLLASADGYFMADEPGRSEMRKRIRNATPLEPGQALVDQVIRMTRGAVQKGVIVDTDGKPVAGALISSHQLDERGRNDRLMDFIGSGGSNRLVSDKQGRFVLGGIRPEMGLVIEAEHPDFPGGGMVAIEAGLIGSEQAKISLTNGGTFEGRIVLEDGGNHEGIRVTLRRRLKQRSPFDDVRTRVEFHGTSDAQGNFEIKNLPAASYRLSVLPPKNYMASDDGQSVVIDGAETTRRDIRLVRTWSISGVVLDQSGAPYRNCQVRIEAEDPKGIIAEERKAGKSSRLIRTRTYAGTDAEGSFSASTLDGRFKYKVRVTAPRDKENPKAKRPTTTIENVEAGRTDLRINLNRP